jgi:hypothetical protein
MIRQWQKHEDKITKRQKQQRKRKLTLAGQDPNKGTWLYTGGPGGANYLQGSENWTKAEAEAAVKELERQLNDKSIH